MFLLSQLFLLGLFISSLLLSTKLCNATTAPPLSPSSELTPEEQAIIHQMSSFKHNRRRQKYEHAESIASTTSQLINSVISEINHFQKVQTLISGLGKEHDMLRALHAELESMLNQMVDSDIHSLNLGQLNHLYDRVISSKEEELKRREMTSTTSNSTLASDSTSTSSEELESDSTSVNQVTIEELEQTFNISTLMNHDNNNEIFKSIDDGMSETLHSYVLAKGKQDYKNKVQSKSLDVKEAASNLINEQKLQQQQKQEQREQLKQEKQKQNRNTPTCSNNIDTLNQVQSSLWTLHNHHGTGKYDHLKHEESRIVYGSEWTSDTYSASKITTTQQKNRGEKTLGDYRTYIPEDWERVLPEGWQSYDITLLYNLISTDPRQYIPNALWHSLPLPLYKLLSPPSSAISYMNNISPEIVTSPRNDIGSCWAMKGANGKITFKLHRPINVESITIVHYPGLSSAHSTTDDNNSSAPRNIHMVGYPSCQLEDENDYDNNMDCTKLGFNRKLPKELGSIEYKPVPKSSSISNPVYDIYGDENVLDDDEDDSKSVYPNRSVQNFVISMISALDSHDGNDDEEDMFGGSCSATKPSSGSDEGENESLDKLENEKVAAITVYIDDNWGNEDYTCIYGIRIHGM
mmetsp:Transcript_20573/g.23299  ORF Transcript_20573/g.23299 Transcript_20573/m.23299 type:complete len:634 (+) Transcript_20573:71-1972(+)